MKTAILIIIIVNGLCTAAVAQNKKEQAIINMLNAQVTEWNKGNIDGYMKGYWENDSLLFIGSKGPRYGYATTLARYKEAYPDTAHMGKLSTEFTRINRLSKKYYFIAGKWSLKRSLGDLSGSFTLLIRKMKSKWVIVCDHSS